MKTALILMLLIAPIIAFAQDGILRPGLHALESKKVTFVVDSIAKDMDIYVDFIDPKDIENVRRKKDLKYPDGVIFITLKNHKKLTDLINDRLISLKEIADVNIAMADKKKPLLYIMDDKILTDTNRVRIPSKHFYKVDVIKASDLPYFKVAMPELLILKIITKPEPIYLR
ncbi:hypothetical protein [Mucilaginibacter conchicola]|nr:hypothetical protein [Mucilaginibacter conchicola]